MQLKILLYHLSRVQSTRTCGLHSRHFTRCLVEPFGPHTTLRPISATLTAMGSNTFNRSAVWASISLHVLRYRSIDNDLDIGKTVAQNVQKFQSQQVALDFYCSDDWLKDKDNNGKTSSKIICLLFTHKAWRCPYRCPWKNLLGQPDRSHPTQSKKVGLCRGIL